MQALLRASEIDFSVSGSIFDEGRPCWGQSRIASDHLNGQPIPAPKSKLSAGRVALGVTHGIAAYSCRTSTYLAEQRVAERGSYSIVPYLLM